MTANVGCVGETEPVGRLQELGRPILEERFRLAQARGHDLTRLGPIPGDPRFAAICLCGWEYSRGDGHHRVGKLTRNVVVGQLVAHLLEVTSDEARAISQGAADAILERHEGKRVSITDNVVPGV